MDLIITILPVVTKDLPTSLRFTPYDFLSRCKFITLTTRQPMVEFYLLTFPRFPLRKNELYKRKIGQDGKVEKYKCRLVAQGFWQVEGVHYTEKYSPTPATASIQMLLAMAAAKDRELRHFDAEQAFLKADIDEEIYIEIPEEFQEFPGAVERLNKAIYGLVQAGRC